jgi:CSLREA domain-containing protein
MSVALVNWKNLLEVAAHIRHDDPCRTLTIDRAGRLAKSTPCVVDISDGAGGARALAGNLLDCDNGKCAVVETKRKQRTAPADSERRTGPHVPVQKGRSRMTGKRATVRVLPGAWRVLSSLLVLVALLGSTVATAQEGGTTFTVNNTADASDRDPTDGVCDVSSAPGGQCTLRAAIQEANGTPNTEGTPDNIVFSIGGASGVKTISVGKPPVGSTTGNGPLPTITDPLIIDGFSQGDSTPSTLDDARENTLSQGNDAVLLVELDGTNAGGGSGLEISAPNSVVRGLAINRFFRGILITGPGTTGVEVRGNFIGTDTSGVQDLGNNTGVEITGPGNTVGGTDPADRNVISGNFNGVEILTAEASGNSVMGNYIGTDASGSGPVDQCSNGVTINDSSGNFVGGTASGAGNVISSGCGSGIELLGASDNRVEGNLIGTDASGTELVGNSIGIYMSGAFDNLVGGTASGAGNVISGNNRGVEIDAGSGNRIQGNFIGTGRNRTEQLGNRFVGIDLLYVAGNTVGGETAAAANTIAFNGQHGVRVEGDAQSTGNRILRNSIFSNAGLGIDLGLDGEPTPNDADDADTGANGLQNSPAITAARASGDTTVVKGTLDSTRTRTFTVQFYSNPPAATDEGKKFLGQKVVTTDAEGRASFTFRPKLRVGAGQFVTATATDDSTGDTSEFSPPRRTR